MINKNEYATVKTAEELFKELGYEKEYSNGKYAISIIYKKYISDTIINYIDFEFNKLSKEVSVMVYQEDGNDGETYPIDFGYMLYTINSQTYELKNNKEYRELALNIFEKYLTDRGYSKSIISESEKCIIIEYISNEQHKIKLYKFIDSGNISIRYNNYDEKISGDYKFNCTNLSPVFTYSKTLERIFGTITAEIYMEELKNTPLIIGE